MTSTTSVRPDGRGRPKGQVQPAPRPANAVPPPQYDCMRAPIWTGSLATPVRDGALDHQQIESRGFRC